MRGKEQAEDQLFYSFSVESRIAKDHPLRAMKKFVDDILTNLSGEFEKIYSKTGRPSTPPEYILKALFLQTLYTIRSEKQLIEQLEYNFLYRWFVGLGVEENVWDESVFSKNRVRLIEGAIADKFFAEVLLIAGRKNLISTEHFSIDGTLLEAWASLKSFQKKEDDIKTKKENKKSDKDPDDRNPSVDFKGEKRSNETHQSTTDPEAKIYTKSIGGNKHYDQNTFVDEMREINVSPHVAQNIHSRRHKSAIDERTTRHPGYDVSQKKRKRIEEIFGWIKNIGLMRRPHFRGKENMTYQFSWSVAIYNLVRIRNLCAA